MRCITLALAIMSVGLLTIRSEIARSERPGPPENPFILLGNSPALELARLVDRVGDEAVAQILGTANPVEVHLVALRASSWMRAPESVLTPIIAMAGGRDSELAPEAARAVLRIANLLDREQLQKREAISSDLVSAGQNLSSIAANPAIRNDIRLCAAQALDLLRNRQILEPSKKNAPPNKF